MTGAESASAQKDAEPVRHEAAAASPEVALHAGVGGVASGWLGHELLARPANAGVRTLAMQRAQQVHGNRYMQRLVSKSGAVSAPARVVQRQCACGGTCAECKTSDNGSVTSMHENGLAEEHPHVQRSESTHASVEPTKNVELFPPGGQPLEKPTRQLMESRFGTDLDHVRVHADSKAAKGADAIGADAYASGRDIYFGASKYATNTREGQGLLAHEITHVIQQQGQPQTAAYSTSGGDALEAEARAASEAVQDGRDFHVTGRTSTAEVQGDVGEWVEEHAWQMFEKADPLLAQIARRGIDAWLKDQISAAVQGLFDAISAPIRATTGAVESLSAHFGELIVWMHEAAEKLARGDCSSVSEAVDKIEKVIDGIASPIIDKVKQLAGKVAAFFHSVWDKFGAPIWDFLKKLGGEAWEGIQQFASQLWDRTLPLRKWGEKAWEWIKQKLGIGDGPDDKDGLLQWVQRKAAAAWEWIKAQIEPIKKPLMVVGGILLLLSPAGPIIVIGGAVTGLIAGIRWIRQHLAGPGGVVDLRSVLEHTIIPGIMGAVSGVTSGLQKAAGTVVERLGSVAAGLGEAVGAAAGSIFRAVSGLLQWIVDQFKSLVQWAHEKLMALVDWVKNGLDKLTVFVQPVLKFLQEIGEVVLDVMKLPAVVLGALWKKIPACIRDPFVNFLVNQVLKRIPLFRQLTEVLPDAWSQVKGAAIAIVHKVFKEGDLLGAALEVFKLVLAVLSIPLELVVAIIAKTANAVDLVLKDPLGFLMNTLRAVGQGFLQFGKNILTHLLNGIAGWIFGSLKDSGVHVEIPKDFSIQSIFNFVLQVLDITVERILTRLEPKIGKDKVALIRRGLDTVAKLWDWMGTLFKEGPIGVWNRLKEQLGNLWQMVLDGAIGWITKKVTEQALKKLASLADPSGITAAVNLLITIYDGVKTVARYAKQILQIVSSVLDLVKDLAVGAIGGAATLLENLLDRAMPVAIGLMAGVAGMGDLTERIQEVIGGIREKIDAAIDWLIEKTIAAGSALLGALGVKQGEAKDAAPKDGKFDGTVGEVVPFAIGKETHKLWVAVKGTSVEIMMASEEKSVEEYLNDYEEKANELDDKEKAAKVIGLIKEARSILVETKTNAQQTEAAVVQANESPQLAVAKNDDTKTAEHSLAMKLKEVREELGLDDPEVIKSDVAQEIEKLPRIMDTTDQLRDVLSQIYERHKARGLKSIKLEPSDQGYDIFVSASAKKFAAHLDGLREGGTGGCWAIIQIDGKVEMDENDDVALTIWNSGRGGPHAERNVGLKLLELEEEGKIGPTSLIEVIIRYSPCKDECRFVLTGIEASVKKKAPNAAFRWYFQKLYVNSREHQTEKMAKEVVENYQRNGIFIQEYNAALADQLSKK